MLNKIIRSCLFSAVQGGVPDVSLLTAGYTERSKKDPYLSKDPVICLMEKRNSVCMSTSFIRYIFPTLALSKSGFRVETESRLLSAGFHQLPVSNIKVVLVLLCIRTGENARENSKQ